MLPAIVSFAARKDCLRFFCFNQDEAHAMVVLPIFSRVCGPGLKPRRGFIAAVLIAEMFFKQARFGAGSENLLGNKGKKNQQEIRLLHVEKKSNEGERRKNVDGIANTGIDTASDKLFRLRRNGERTSELSASDSQQGG